MKILFTEPDCYSDSFLKNLPKQWNSKFIHIYNQLELINLLKNENYEVIFGKLGINFSEKVISLLKGKKILVTPTTGHDHIDLNALDKYGVKLLSLRNEVDFLQEITSTAEHAWALLLAGSRRINSLVSRTKSGSWRRDDLQLSQISGKNVGIIGYGRLGKIISEYANAFRMNIFFCDPNVENVKNTKVKKTSLNKLLEVSDYIFISASYLPGDPPILTAKELNFVKKGAGLINIARGELIDEKAVLENFNNGTLSFIAVDVLNGDSSWGKDDLIESEIVSQSATNDGIIITPHVGGYSKEAIFKTREFMLTKLKKHIKFK